MKALQMIRQLTNAPGASGFEDAVVEAARQWAADIGPMEEDFRRNLYIHRKENKGGRPVVVIDAHTDEVSFMIQCIKPNGTLLFVSLGSWNKDSLGGTKVMVRNALGEYIPGVIASKPGHFASSGEKASPIDEMVIDVGAVSKADAVENFHIRIGEPAVPATEFSYDEEHGLMFAKAFDCRIGCAAALEALRRLDGEELPCDVVCTLSAQEEVGPKNSAVVFNRVKPDIAIIMEGAPADDTFVPDYAAQTALKRGPMLRHMDVSAICAPRFQRFALDLAREKGIPVQEAVRRGGGNNASSAQTVLNGAPSIVVGVPVRYAHSPNCICSYQDFEAAVELIIALLRTITKEHIQAM